MILADIEEMSGFSQNSNGVYLILTLAVKSYERRPVPNDG